MKWNEYNAAVSASNESARADSHHRAGPEPPETENKKPNRTRNNKITVYLSDAELSRLNAMVDKTIMNREQFIRKMIEGKTITEAPPAPLLQTVRMMKDAQFNIRRISECALLSRPIDEELLRKTLEDINTCVQEVIINNGPRKTVAELEEQSKTGTPISLLELAQAVQREDEEKHRAQQPVRREKSGEKPSILAKLKTPSVADTKSVKSAPKRSAEREL